MDRTTSKNLFVTGRRVTRFQVDQVKRTFPFLLLPAEMRNHIYVYATDIDAIEAFFDKAHAKLTGSHDSRRQRLSPRKKTPNVFLINKQIYQEARYLLQKRSINFTHGLLKVDHLSDVITVDILRKLTSIEISDDGHNMLEGRILPTSWSGYMKLIKELGDILGRGHNLKEFKINLHDERLEEHMTLCHENPHKCGFRDQMTEALWSLRQVRSVKKVELIGLNAVEAADLTKRMTSDEVNFSHLPRELRDMVYDYCMDWSDVSQQLNRSLANWTDKKQPFPFPTRTCPTVLLLNKQINREATEALQKKPLNITCPADHSITQQDKIPSILGFISRHAFKKAKTINMKMESWEWVFNFDRRLIAALSASMHLENFHFSFRDSLKKDFLAHSTQSYPDNKIAASLKGLKKVRGLKQVTFDGDLPLVYTDALAQIMTSRPAFHENLPVLKAINRAGEIVNVDERDESEIQQQQAAQQ